MQDNFLPVHEFESLRNDILQYDFPWYKSPIVDVNNDQDWQLCHNVYFENTFQSVLIVQSDFKMRLRYFLGLNIPLTKKENNKLYFSAYNEIFLNTEPAVFDRNRLYGGIGYRINKNIRLEAGYMNQFFEKNSSDQLNIIVSDVYEY